MELLIDNQAEPLESLGFHYQGDPFPGTHNYLLKLNDASLAADLRGKFGSSVLTPSRQDAETIFGMLNSVISFKRLTQPNIPLRFLANSIESLEVASDVAVCRGLCSKVT